MGVGFGIAALGSGVGIALIIVGALISLTGAGAIIGIPLIIIGFIAMAGGATGGAAVGTVSTTYNLAKGKENSTDKVIIIEKTVDKLTDETSSKTRHPDREKVTVNATLPSGEGVPIKIKLKRLDSLFADGVVSEKEYIERKNKLIHEYIDGDPNNG